MKSLPLLLAVSALCHASLQAQSASLSVAPTPTGSNIRSELFWVADARKMDAFLAKVPVAQWRNGAPTREVLPETTTAWRDYATQAYALARRGREAEAAGRLAQMIKLAAVYRAHGGLQNMVQAEEIRFLAGQTAAELGTNVAAKIQSPYLERSAADCLAIIDSWAGNEAGTVTATFWQQLRERAVLSHARLSRTGKVKLAANG